ncbi:23S rRNA (guanosine(2251)-2'-O)-methyltransferase RlmB [Ornithobacterium rhinotracheale]|uniref:23S rRNA (Guanosine(2251)-2'-O)-methyltransferase RlmB n=1 Tax=Ornithobacterium rhinotracheale TaxID=28251 RepID=A0A410JQZ0_ORNRH|nr:23S rRNA (guanosine(2251)-2'-O)-methyltransferase RlmB [Ornithobacterium rhinotracheale]QAR30570.1 23S rRNA (guanosine(2251)-2'-O)-methyltransferase RlmB [Ornithobacterium rhinotracheale]
MRNDNKIFGLHPVLEAIDSGKTIDKLFVQKGLQGELASEVLRKARALGIPMQYVPVQKLNKLTRKNHQGVFGYLSPIEFYKIDQILPLVYEKGETPFFLILDRLSDVRNFGAIARTAECCGVHAIVVPERGAAAINEDALKTSAGALFKIPVCREKSLKEVVSFLQLSGVSVVCATEKTEDTIYNTDLTKPLAIVMGNEGDGVAEELLNRADYLAKLPMRGEIGSLNVSVACGAFLYEAIRQREFA